jgi:hypothetical protein
MTDEPSRLSELPQARCTDRVTIVPTKVDEDRLQTVLRHRRHAPFQIVAVRNRRFRALVDRPREQ